MGGVSLSSAGLRLEVRQISTMANEVRTAVGPPVPPHPPNCTSHMHILTSGTFFLAQVVHKDEHMPLTCPGAPTFEGKTMKI